METLTPEESVIEWLDKKYQGAKELGDWTPEDVMEFTKYYASQVSEEEKRKAFEAGREKVRTSDGIMGVAYLDKYEDFDSYNNK